jgi:hypothetical protein
MQRTGAGAELLEVLLLVEGLLSTVSAALKRLDPLRAHQANQGAHHRVREQTAFFEREDGVEEAFHDDDGCTLGRCSATPLLQRCHHAESVFIRGRSLT